MPEYRRDKLKTAWQLMRRIENWPTAFGLRLRPNRPTLRLLNFRDGLNVVCRGVAGDWVVIHELLFAGGYQNAFEYLKTTSHQPLVLDLDGNIGLFSLLAARSNPSAQIHAYEPGPPNYRLFEMNCLANPALAPRIHLQKEAVAGHTCQSTWFFDELNPGGSGFFAATGSKVLVQIRAFADVINSLPAPADLLKMDIEGSEYELLAETPPQVWQRVKAISLELHHDPKGKLTQQDFLTQMKNLGYTIEGEEVCSLFLRRR